MDAAQILGLAITAALPIALGLVAYGKLQGRLDEATRDIAELKAEDERLHQRVSGKGDEYNDLKLLVTKEITKLVEGQRHICDRLDRITKDGG